MKDMIRSQLYELRKNRLLYICFGLLLLMQFTIWGGETNYQIRFPLGDYLAQNIIFLVLLGAGFACCVVGIVCGNNFMDKTIYYEIMGRYTRWEVYLSRVLVSLFIGLTGAFLLMLVPVMVLGNMGSMGEILTVWDVLARIGLTMFPIGRLICEMVCLTMLVHIAYVPMLIGFLIAVTGEVFVSGIFHAGGLSALGSIRDLVDFSVWNTYSLAGSRQILVYDTTISMHSVVRGTVCSVVFGVIFFVLGYVFFHKDDC